MITPVGMQLEFLNPMIQMNGCPAAVFAGYDLLHWATTVIVNLHFVSRNSSTYTREKQNPE